MINQQVSPRNYVEKIISKMSKDKTPIVRVVKFDVKKVSIEDFIQTQDYWSTLAVIS